MSAVFLSVSTAQKSFRFSRDFINNLLFSSHMVCVCYIVVVWTWILLCSLLSLPSTNHSPSLSGLLNIFYVSFFATLNLKPFVISLQTVFLFLLTRLLLEPVSSYMPYSLSVLHTTDFDLSLCFYYLVQYGQHVIFKDIVSKFPNHMYSFCPWVNMCCSLSLCHLLSCFHGTSLFFPNLTLTLPFLWHFCQTLK